MRRTWKAKYTRSSKNRWLQHTLQFIFDTIIRSTFPGKDCTRHFVVSVLHHCVICHLSYKSYKRVVSWFDPKWLSNIGNVRNAINLFFGKKGVFLMPFYIHLLWPLLIITPYTLDIVRIFYLSKTFSIFFIQIIGYDKICISNIWRLHFNLHQL